MPRTVDIDITPARDVKNLARLADAFDDLDAGLLSAAEPGMSPPEESDDPMLYDIGRDFVFALMTGVALQRLVPRGQRPASEHIDALKRMFRLLRSPRS